MAETLNTMTGFDVLPDFEKEEEQASIVPAGLKTDKEIEKEINRAGDTAKPITPRLMTPANPKGEEPGKGMGFVDNVRGSFRSNTMAGAATEAAEANVVRDPTNLGRSPLARSEALIRDQYPEDANERIDRLRAGTAYQDIQARRRDEREKQLPTYQDNIFDQIAYDFSEGNLSVASVAGTVIGNLPSPEMALALPGKVVGALGLAERPIARAAAEGAVTNLITDPVVQAIRMGSGAQQNYELEQTLLAPVVGAAGGAALGGAGVVAKRGLDRLRARPAAGESAPTTIAEADIARAIEDAVAPEAPPARPVTQEAAPVPPRAPEAPADVRAGDPVRQADLDWMEGRRPVSHNGSEYLAPDADHRNLFEIGRRSAVGEKQDPAMVQSVLDRFRGYLDTDEIAGWNNFADVLDHARDYFDSFKVDAPGSKVRLDYAVGADAGAAWRERQIAEMGSRPATVLAEAVKSAEASVTAAKSDATAIQKADAVSSVPPSPGKDAGVFMFDATRLNVDADRFQYKSDGDAEGVTSKLRFVKEWDASKANQIIVWMDKDGKFWVADGHQRSGLARRLSKDGAPIELPGLLYRETDGFTAQSVMMLAAAKNIAEGSGTILDAAKIIRIDPRIGNSLSGISDYRIRQAQDLAKLQAEPWRMTVNEMVSPEQAALVGRIIPDDEARQMAAIDAIVKMRPANADETAALIAKVRAAAMEKENAGAQTSLFGDDPATSTVMEEVRIVANAVKLMRSDKALFSRVVNDADRIEGASDKMKIDRATAEQTKDDAGRIAAYIQSQADTAGPIRTALLELAKEVKNGTRSYAEAARALVAAVRDGSGSDVSTRAGAGRPDEAGSGRAAAGEPRAAERPGEPGRSGGGSPVDPGAALEARIRGDFPGVVKEYADLPESNGGRILSADIARELSPEYRADRTRASEVHEPVSALVKRMYAEKLAQPTPEGLDSRIIFTAGGAGAGKTTGLNAVGPRVNRAEMIYDSNLRSFDSAKQRIDQALEAGRTVEIVYTFRDPVESLVNGALARAMIMERELGSGRTLPISEHIRTHIDAQDVVVRLRNEYADNPGVKIIAVDNTRGLDNVRVVSLEQIRRLNEQETTVALRSALDEQFREGRISRPVYEGFRGREAGPEGRAPSAARPGNNPKPENDGGSRTEPGADGKPQGLIEGVRPVTDGDRIAVQADKPMRGGNAGPDEGGLFGPDPGAQRDIFDMPNESRMSASRTGFMPGSVDRQFPGRRQLPGEASKGRQPPANATPDEIKNFRVTEAIRDLADGLGMKVEVDGRFTSRNALGVYKTKEGVIRLRNDGDIEVFAHELSHALDARLRQNPETTAEWKAMLRANAAELKPLDANTSDPAKQTVTEGIAEFLRMYATNPAYAQKQAPAFFAKFEAWVGTASPETLSALQAAGRISQIDSGLSPTQAMESMIVPGDTRKGLSWMMQSLRKEGLAPTAKAVVDLFLGRFFGADHYVKRLVNGLMDEQFKLTGLPTPRLMRKDPYKLFRLLPASGQIAGQMIETGVRPFNGENGPAITKGLAQVLSTAYQGAPADSGEPIVKGFSAYLIARRAASLYDRWKAGEMMAPPVRRSETEVRQAVAEYERQYPHFRAAADDVFNITRAMLERQRDAGLIPTEIFEAIAKRGDDYVPFFRDMDDSQAGGGKRGGADLTSQPIKKIKGSTRDIIDPVESVIFEMISAERRIAMNRFVNALDSLRASAGMFGGRWVETVPNNELKGTGVDLLEAVRMAARQKGLAKADAEIMIRMIDEAFAGDVNTTLFRNVETTARGERILFGWRNGERFALKLNNDVIGKNLFDVVARMSQQESDAFFNAFGKANAFFSQMITNAPQFALKNIVMDNVSRMFIGRDVGIAGRIPFASIAYGIGASFDKQFKEAYNLMGGIRGGVASQFARELNDSNPGKAVTELMPSSLLGSAVHLVSNPGEIPKALFKAPASLLGAYVRLLESTETLGRLGQAKIVYNHLKKQGLSDAEAMHGATFEARDVLDYDRRGTMVSGINRFLPFFNANMQGMARANKTLFGDVVEALATARQRGGIDKLDGEMRANLEDGAVNLLLVGALAPIVAAGYYAYVKDDPAYQKRTDYMKRRYFIIPVGDENYMTIPKPFDAPGSVMAAVEFGLQMADKGNPRGFDQIVKSIADGLIPRHLQGVEEFVGSSPWLKTAFETTTGMRMGFEGNPARPIVPDSLRALPNEMQYTATTSAVAKMVGNIFGASPMVVDHVMNGLGATTARDINAVISGIEGSNPNLTTGDAINRLFFGGLYRRELTSGSVYNSDIMKLMARNSGDYMREANGYKTELKEGSKVSADIIFNKANDTSKAMMVMMSDPKRFPKEERQLHPLIRTNTVYTTLSSVLRQLSDKEVEIRDRSRRGSEEIDVIEMSPTQARTLSGIVNTLIGEEVRNGLAAAKHPGYQNFPLIDTKARYDAIRAASPQLADEIAKRFKEDGVLPIEGVAEQWPQVQKSLVRDREAARLRSNLIAARSGRAREVSNRP